MRLFALALGLALATLPATQVWGAFGAGNQTWANGCSYSTQPNFTAVTPGVPTNDSINIKNLGTACFDFDEDTDGAAIHTPWFTINAVSAQICIMDDMNAVASGTAAVEPHLCAGVAQPATVAEEDQVCLGLGVLDGTPGDAVAQDACVRVGPGVYFVEATDCGAAADFCRIFIQAEGPLN